MDNRINIMYYRTREELQNTHPDVKNWTCIHHAPRGQSLEANVAGLKQAMTKRGKWFSLVYQIGDFFWTPAETTPRVGEPS